MPTVLCPGSDQAPVVVCPGEDQAPIILCPEKGALNGGPPATTCALINTWVLPATGSYGLRGIDIVRDPGLYDVALASDDKIRLFNPEMGTVRAIYSGVDQSAQPVNHIDLVCDRAGATWDIYTLSNQETHADGSGVVRIYGGGTGNLLFRIGGKNPGIGGTAPAGNWLLSNLIRDRGPNQYLWCTAFSQFATGDPTQRWSLWGMNPGGPWSFPGGLIDPVSAPEKYTLIPGTPTQINDGPYSIFGDSLGNVWVALVNGKVYHFYPGGSGTWALVHDFHSAPCPRWFAEGPGGYVYGFNTAGSLFRFSKLPPAYLGEEPYTGSYGFNQNPLLTDSCGYIWTGDGRYNVVSGVMTFEPALSVNASGRLGSQNTVQHNANGKVYSTGVSGNRWLLTEADCTCF